MGVMSPNVPPVDAAQAIPSDDAPPLMHVIVAAGSLAEWAATPDERWAAMAADLGKVADQVGAHWLALRPVSGGSEADARLAAARAATVQVGGCAVTIDAEADGRVRLAAAAERCRLAGEPIDESHVSAVLNDPALVDADLVLVAGIGHRLPTSLVWELAYSELVFLDVSFADLSAAHLEDAIASYRHRHRRFGGVD